MKFTIHTFSFLILTLFFSVTAIANEDLQFKYFAVNDPNNLNSDKSGSPINTVNPLDSTGNLYQQILDEMNLQYNHIGMREAQRVLANRSSVTGGLNSIGFSYQRPFVDFSIAVDRQLEPMINDNKVWIVRDFFTIYIDASRVLSNLKDRKVIDISDQNLAAFAGIVFQRKYSWVHFASSYEEGLTTHFEKLFLPFAALNFDQVARLQNNEIIYKEDSLSINAGGLVTAPLYTGVTGMAGVLAKFEKLSKIEVVSVPKAEGNEVQINTEKTKIAKAGISLAIQADFLKILKMTLLSFDFSYQLESSYKIFLNLKQADLLEMNQNSPVAVELREVLKNREGDLDVLAPYVISEEKKISQLVSQRYNFLLAGGSKNSKTSQIEITSQGRVKTFFRHYYEKIKYTDDALSRLFASFIFALLDTDISANKLASDTKRVAFEYDSEKNLIESHEDLSIAPNEQKLSLSFTAEFMTRKTSGMLGGKYRDRAVFLLERYSGVDPMAINLVKNEYLKAPYKITGQYEVTTEGIRHFNSLSVDQAFDFFSGLCNEQPKSKFFNFRNLFDNCRRSLENDYMDYLKDLTHERVTADSIDRCEKKSMKYFLNPGKKRAFIKDCLSQLTYKDAQNWVEIPLWQLKNITTNIVNNSNSKVHYYNLFGVQNVFFHGNFSAVTLDGGGFITSFHEGAFKGLGVVDHFMRQENIRAPSSIVVDQ